jgi:hypothetical protein
LAQYINVEQAQNRGNTKIKKFVFIPHSALAGHNSPESGDRPFVDTFESVELG